MGIHPKVESYADIFNLPLLDLVAIMAKESGEMIDSVLIDEDDHWIKELGDICGLIIPPLLERAGLTYGEAAEIGRERFETKLIAHLRGEKAPTHKEAPAQKIRGWHPDTEKPAEVEFYPDGFFTVTLESGEILRFCNMKRVPTEEWPWQIEILADKSRKRGGGENG